MVKKGLTEFFKGWVKFLRPGDKPADGLRNRYSASSSKGRFRLRETVLKTVLAEVSTAMFNLFWRYMRFKDFLGLNGAFSLRRGVLFSLEGEETVHFLIFIFHFLFFSKSNMGNEMTKVSFLRNNSWSVSGWEFRKPARIGNLRVKFRLFRTFFILKVYSTEVKLKNKERKFLLFYFEVLPFGYPTRMVKS